MQVIGQIIGPFGLSTAMFEDRNGGNVTTLRNFERKDDDYVATDSDRALHAHSRKDYNAVVRSEYEIDTGAKAKNAGAKTGIKSVQIKLARAGMSTPAGVFLLTEPLSSQTDGLSAPSWITWSR
ncbi:hypothetical protein O0544_02525 [Edwardsiella anguillarum]|nr:hypothetical protein [Edwardsiella anguillarum]